MSRLTVSPRALQVFDGPADGPARDVPAAYGVTHEPRDSWQFSVRGEAPQLRSMVWTAPLAAGDLSAARCFALRYRALGLARSHAPRPVVALVEKDASGKETLSPLLDSAEVYNDDLWHVVIGRRPMPPTATALRVQVSTEDSTGSLSLGALEFFATTPVPSLERGLAPELSRAAKSLKPLDLDSLCNDTVAAALDRVLAKEGLVTDGCGVADGLSAVSGVPFHFAAGGNNLVRPRTLGCASRATAVWSRIAPDCSSLPTIARSACSSWTPAIPGAAAEWPC